jgi:hypothetical protein
MDAQRSSSAVRQFAAEQNRRRQWRIESMIRELSLRVANLEKDIGAEERRTRITDPKHFAYSIPAKAAAVRRDNLLRTIEGLKKLGDFEELPSATAGDRQGRGELGGYLGRLFPSRRSAAVVARRDSAFDRQDAARRPCPSIRSSISSLKRGEIDRLGQEPVAP